MNSNTLEKLLITAIIASQKAGEEILKVYDSDFSFEQKADSSPLTLADKKAHEVIEGYLNKTSLPVLSEEGKDIPHQERKDWQYFWLVDPLDGTKEFIKRNGEFTVNIALIYHQQPILGVIYLPVKDILYFAGKGIGAYKKTKLKTLNFELLNDLIAKAEKLPIGTNREKYTVIASRSHMSEETRNYIDKLQKEKGNIDIISAGSALKLCMVAEGKADVYPRFAPTMEWDTAAGQAIVQEAGKQLLIYDSGEVMEYNRENLVNGWFIVRYKIALQIIECMVVK